jgi:hypothetical protein
MKPVLYLFVIGILFFSCNREEEGVFPFPKTINYEFIEVAIDTNFTEENWDFSLQHTIHKGRSYLYELHFTSSFNFLNALDWDQKRTVTLVLE